MNSDLGFSPDPATRRAACQLYAGAAGLPRLCPHGHVDARLFSDPAASFGSPADLFILPDHYVVRMLYSHGVPLEALGIPVLDPGVYLPGARNTPCESDHRRIWRTFCENFHIFRGTPSGIWLTRSLEEVFDVREKPCAENADRLYDAIAEKLALPEFSPRALYERFNIELLCTTDAAADDLEHHRRIRASGWKGRILPAFRPDSVVNLEAPGWRANLDALARVSGMDIPDFSAYLRALEARREFFKSMGALATDHDVLDPLTAELTPAEADAIFQRALRGRSDPGDAPRFTAHMLMEMARMSIEDGLVMQMHTGSYRNHNRPLNGRFGADHGDDLPVRCEYTRNLRPLLNRYGNDTRLALIIFTLDESAYTRELAPLAGHYPALKLGPPWWFHDSLNGMRRYFDQVMETAGLYKTAGFNDDTRGFCSIPARHDLWRRAGADWLAGLVVRHVLDMPEAGEMMQELAVGLARRAYRIPGA